VKPFMMQCSPLSCHFSFLDPIIFLSVLFLNTLHIHPYLNLSGQISHPCDTAEMSLVLHALVFFHAHCEGKRKRFWTE